METKSCVGKCQALSVESKYSLGGKGRKLARESDYCATIYRKEGTASLLLNVSLPQAAISARCHIMSDKCIG